MRCFLICTALALSACGPSGDAPGSADSAAVTPAADTTIKTDTVKVAGDTAKML